MDRPTDRAREHTDTVEQDKAAVMGRVGIFWFLRSAIISDSVPCTHGEQYGDFVNGRSDHCTFWPRVQRRLPEAARYEYDQVPRGRVVYSKKDDRFLVYGSEKFVGNEEQRGIVAASFNLPLEKTLFRSDEHYSNIPGMLNEEFSGD